MFSAHTCQRPNKIASTPSECGDGGGGGIAVALALALALALPLALPLALAVADTLMPLQARKIGNTTEKERSHKSMTCVSAPRTRVPA